MKIVSVLNLVNVSDLRRSQLFLLMFQSIKNKTTSIFLNVNSHGLYIALQNRKYREILNAADVLYADGWGPVLFSKIASTSLTERINVGDYIYLLLALFEKKGINIYFLGCEDHVVLNAVKEVENQFQNIRIVGFHNGFFDKRDERLLLEEIRDLDTQVILLGMGNPLQEEFLWRNRKNLPPALYITVGGVFHYLAKTKKRAPIWMRDNSLEWMYRLIQEPKRLFFRYSYELAYIGIILIRYLFLTRFGKIIK